MKAHMSVMVLLLALCPLTSHADNVCESYKNGEKIVVKGVCPLGYSSVGAWAGSPQVTLDTNRISNIAKIMGNRGVTEAPPAPANPYYQNRVQQMGVTNPLLQQLGNSIGRMTGQDMRSPAQQAAAAALKQQELQQQQQQTRSQANGLFAQALDYSPERKMKVAQQLIRMGAKEEGLALYNLAKQERAGN